MTDELRISIECGIARIVFARAHKRNAMTPAMRTSITERLDHWSRDASVRVLLLQGDGTDFSAGSDMEMAGRQTARERLAVFTALHAFPKSVIAAVQGACIGAAVALVACCDAVVASPAAFFAVPEVRLGFPPGVLGPLLLRGLGERGYRRYVLSGERFDAATAHAIGLVTDIADDPVQRAGTIAREWLKAAPGAMASAKKLLAAPNIESLLADEESVLHTDEAREGLAAARERRRPNWNLEDTP